MAPEGIVVKEQPSLKLRAVFQPEQVREMQVRHCPHLVLYRTEVMVIVSVDG